MARTTIKDVMALVDAMNASNTAMNQAIQARFEKIEGVLSTLIGAMQSEHCDEKAKTVPKKTKTPTKTPTPKQDKSVSETIDTRLVVDGKYVYTANAKGAYWGKFRYAFGASLATAQANGLYKGAKSVSGEDRDALVAKSDKYCKALVFASAKDAKDYAVRFTAGEFRK